jgi:hypothetical protein
MTVTDTFINDAPAFASRYAFMVDEHLIAVDKARDLTGLVNGPNPLNTASWLLGFTVELMGNNGAKVIIHPAGTAGTTPCYFLPYKPDCAISLDCAAGADFFFTSSLSGCTVQAHGPRATPTVTHANARTLYATTLAGVKTAAQDGIASLAAQAHMNAMLPAVAGAAHHGMVTRAQYVGALTGANMTAAQGRFRLKKAHHTLTGFAAKMVEGYKPESGAFVFGQRTGTDWSFWYQATVGVQGMRNTGRWGFGVKQKPLFSEEVVLGAALRFYP